MYFLSIKDEIWDILARLLESLARYLFFFIGKFIYSAIRYVYNIFVALCNGRILDNDSIMALFSRIGVILGVVMLFVVSFSVIQLLVNPDAINDAEKGIQNIVKKVIFVIVMLGVSGYVFNILAEVQAIVIERDIIPKLLLPRAVSSENVGGNLSAELFMIFYQVGVEPEDDACGETYRDSTKAAIANGDFTPVSTCLTAGSGEGDGWVFFLEYNWLFSTIFGMAALWFIFSYCITVGVRLIQLTFLQIISPAAIIGYLSPKKDNIFSKWVKIYFSTYIDVFIRIAIINFAMYLIALIMSEYNSDTSTFWTSVGSPGIWTKGFIAAIMITAILQFAKKAPELLKQLLPQGASGLGFSPNNEYGAKMLGMAAGGIAGFAGGIAGGMAAEKGRDKFLGALTGGASGIFRGGAKGIGNKNPFDLRKSFPGGYGAGKSGQLQAQKRIAAGGSRFPWQRIGAQTRANRADAIKDKLNAKKSTYSAYTGKIDAAKTAAQKKWEKGTTQVWGNVNGQRVDLAARALDLRSQLELATSSAMNKSQIAEYLDKMGAPVTDELIEAEYQRQAEQISNLRAESIAADKAATEQFISNTMLDSNDSNYIANAEVSSNVEMAQQIYNTARADDPQMFVANTDGLTGFDLLDAINDAAQAESSIVDSQIYANEKDQSNIRARADSQTKGGSS